MGTRPNVTPEEALEIARLYRDEKMTIEAVAGQTGRSTDTIWRALKRLDVPLHPRITDLKIQCSDEDLAKMYTVGLMDTYEMARHFDVCSETISKRLKRAGVKMRPSGTPGAQLRSGERGVHGLSYHPLYQIWNGMIQRCCSPTNKGWDDYGGAGVTVCDRWRKRPEGFANFLEDMGEKPVGTSLDRIDPFGNYEPSNCRWATLDQQANNKRGSKGSLQRMAEEIEMWRQRALQAEALLAELSAGSRRRRLRAVQDHLGQPEGGALAVALFEFDADGLPSEVPGSDESAA